MCSLAEACHIPGKKHSAARENSAAGELALPTRGKIFHFQQPFHGDVKKPAQELGQLSTRNSITDFFVHAIALYTPFPHRCDGILWAGV